MPSTVFDKRFPGLHSSPKYNAETVKKHERKNVGFSSLLRCTVGGGLQPKKPFQKRLPSFLNFDVVCLS